MSSASARPAVVVALELRDVRDTHVIRIPIETRSDPKATGLHPQPLNGYLPNGTVVKVSAANVYEPSDAVNTHLSRPDVPLTLDQITNIAVDPRWAATVPASLEAQARKDITPFQDADQSATTGGSTHTARPPLPTMATASK